MNKSLRAPASSLPFEVKTVQSAALSNQAAQSPSSMISILLVFFNFLPYAAGIRFSPQTPNKPKHPNVAFENDHYFISVRPRSLKRREKGCTGGSTFGCQQVLNGLPWRNKRMRRLCQKTRAKERNLECPLVSSRFQTENVRPVLCVCARVCVQVLTDMSWSPRCNSPLRSAGPPARMNDMKIPSPSSPPTMLKPRPVPPFFNKLFRGSLQTQETNKSQRVGWMSSCDPDRTDELHTDKHFEKASMLDCRAQNFEKSSTHFQSPNMLTMVHMQLV